MTWGTESVRVSFGPRVALASLSMTVEPSRILVVVGGDGAGKTTALRTLAGLVRPEAGVVRRPEKSRIGYVPAVGGIYQDLTVGENVRFAARAYGLTGASLHQRASSIIERVGLGAAATRLASQLSGGMQRKLAVATALVHEPEMLVLDEPTTGIDPVSRAELWRLVAGSAAAGAAVVLATTYVKEAIRGTGAILLEAGRVLAVGAPGDIVESLAGAVGTWHGSTPPTPLSWRRGATWRVWSPDGRLPAGAVAVEPDFEDAAVVAALADELEVA
jgi:ABC-2 type transport system ATP-binding protein